MKGIILAGGLGTRLMPSTKVVNKHLLPVYNQPMIFYPIRTLVNSGITDILIISSREHVGNFIELLGSGTEFQARFTYKVQEGPSGIAHALSLAREYVGNDSFALVLGDNIFTESFEDEVKNFTSGARIFLKEVDDPERFGIAEIAGNKVISIEEKPLRPKSNLAITGFYFYDNNAFDYLNEIKPSIRGELEITDLNRRYLEKNQLTASILKGLWTDAGTHDSLVEASSMLQKIQPSYSFKSSKTKQTHKVEAGVLLYQSENYDAQKYFEPFFESLLKQDYPNIEIAVLDNGSPDKTGFNELKQKYPEVKFLTTEKNLGFGGGHNFIIKNTSSDYYACLNFDIVFESDFISKLVNGIQLSPEIGSVTGKIKRWDFERYQKAKEEGNLYEDGKTNFIDTVGLKIKKNHRFEDKGQGEVDYGQYNETCEIFGVSGAAALFKRNALESIAFVNDIGEKEYFDELFFMYKEDIDLAYRMQWAGWKSYYISDAVAHHDRSVVSAGSDIFSIARNRRLKSKRVNEWSFLNQEILLAKHFKHRKFSHDVKSATKWYKFKSLIYILLFEPHLLRQYRRLSDMAEQIEKRVLRMPKNIKESKIEKLME